jgi:hypothetical protein
MPALPRYQIPSSFSEKQIEADVATFFGMCDAGHREIPFRLLDIDEQIYGADKKFDSVIPIYMQFKKSTGLLSPQIHPVSKRKGRSRLEEIREWREAQGFDEIRSLCFKIHEKAKTAIDYQHNVLFSYENPPSTRGIYVAPLSLDSEAYFEQLTTSARELIWPFYHRFDFDVVDEKALVYFYEVPFLRAHVSIPPHKQVKDANHYYSFSETATNVSWHSPLLVDEGPSRLSDYLRGVIRGILTGHDDEVSLDATAKRVVSIAEQYGFGDQSGLHQGPMELLQSHGRWINKTFGIKQFLLCYNNSLRQIRYS